jgi:hypothetical protein
MKPLTPQHFLTVYSASLTTVLAAMVLMGARSPAPNARFDQITVHRINVVEPDGTMRMVLSDKAEFPGSYYMGKEYPRPDRHATGMLFNDEEGTETGGLIFGGNKDEKSWGHLSFDEYQRDQTIVLESSEDGGSRTTAFAINDDNEVHPITPEVSREWQRIHAMPEGPERRAARQAFLAKYPGKLVNRGYFGRASDQSVGLTLSDQQGQPRLIARVGADGSAVIQFLDSSGKVLRTISAEANRE